MPRPNLFTTPARTSSIFIPGTLPFLAPRVFAPWPKELGRRNVRSQARSAKDQSHAQTLQALQKISHEQSDNLAAALGGSAFFDDTDDFEQWRPSSLNQFTGDIHTGAQSREGDTRTRPRERSDKRRASKRPKPRQMAFALERQRVMARRRRKFSYNNRKRNQELLAAMGQTELAQEHPPQRYMSLPGTAFVRIISPKDSKLQELRRYLGEKKWLELRAGYSGKRHILKRGTRRPNDLNNMLYHEILKLDGPQISELYNAVEASGVDIHPYTRMQFIHHLARKGETMIAARALETLHEHGADFATTQMMQFCSTLLQSKFRSKVSSPTDLELFDWMVGCGLQPNGIIYNILMHNSLQRHDRKTAYEIYEAMKERGVEPDNFTYSILLNEAKASGDMKTVQQIFQIASEAEQPDKYILADLLHAIYLLYIHSTRTISRRRRSKTSCLEPMFGILRRFFFTQPFLDLIPPHRMPPQLTAVFPESTKRQRMEPDGVILYLMISCQIRSLHEPGEVLEYYRHFQKLVKQDHHSVRYLAGFEAMYNVFLIALGRWEDTLPVCAEVLQSMIAPAATESEVQEDSLPVSRPRPQPSVRSWSILLKAFMKHEQPRAAEKVLKMMQDRGITPSDVTWNYLIGGYAILQDVQAAFDARDRMIVAGLTPNDDTEWRFDYIKNKDALNRMRAARGVDDGEHYMDEDGDDHGWKENQDDRERNENQQRHEWEENQEELGSNERSPREQSGVSGS